MKKIKPNLEVFSLDLPKAEFKQGLEQTISHLLALEEKLEEKAVYNQRDHQEVAQLFAESLPSQATDILTVVEQVSSKIIPNSNLSIGPYFQAYVMSCSNHAGFIGQVISTFLNQNATKWHLGPASAELEQLVIRWMKTFMNLPTNSAGVLVSGGSAANLTCLTVARNAMFPTIKVKGIYDTPPITMYVSTETHYCVVKASELLGIGSEYVRKIKVKKDFTIDLSDLKKHIDADLEAGFCPFCVVGNSGTVNTGAIDPLLSLAKICEEYQLWFHIDGAYGGLAAGVPELKGYYDGMAAADSIAVDPHKWLYVPFEAGCALFKEEQELPKTFSHVPDYLAADKTKVRRKDFMEYGIQLSRSDKALKIWMTFKVLGAEKLLKAIALDVVKAHRLAELLSQNPNFEMLSVGPLSIICYRLNPVGQSLTESEMDHLNQQLLDEIERDGTVFITGTRIHGKKALRSCFVNHRTQERHLVYTATVLNRIAQGLLHNIHAR